MTMTMMRIENENGLEALIVILIDVFCGRSTSQIWIPLMETRCVSQFSFPFYFLTIKSIISAISIFKQRGTDGRTGGRVDPVVDESVQNMSTQR